MSGRHPGGPRPLPRTFYERPTLEVARDLLGKVLVRRDAEGLASGLIVETEAYIGESDPACHAASGPTPRNQPLYGAPGRAYVYFTYGMHYLVNAVTERRGFPAAVLIRALEPIEGVDLMRRRRVGRGPGGARRRGSARALPAHHLCRGPGNLARALGITLAENRADLTKRAGRNGAGLWIEDRGVPVDDVVWTPRIGIRSGTDLAWRCVAAGSPAASTFSPSSAAASRRPGP
ncbi:MAG TPA: DNA-3-methyladenine glycosylase [Vicinamibacterales bacterium]|nr:DNA-3-methyladenine glycosylase [Vicinamibacterales bacterium]HPK72882.1 DNA-3-methyladenine glycosylase [Vicinamibacterales bacterium]